MILVSQPRSACIEAIVESFVIECRIRIECRTPVASSIFFTIGMEKDPSAVLTQYRPKLIPARKHTELGDGADGSVRALN